VNSNNFISMPILYMLKVSVYAGFMQIFSGTYCGLSLNQITIGGYGNIG